jgi:hypothetical protein
MLLKNVRIFQATKAMEKYFFLPSKPLETTKDGFSVSDPPHQVIFLLGCLARPRHKISVAAGDHLS